MKVTPLLFLNAIIFCVQALGAADEPAELAVRYEHYYVNYRLSEDAASVTTRDWAMTVLKERAVSWAKQASISYSTSVQKAEVLEAYTRKADGRRIDSPKSNFQVEANSGKGNDDPIFSDRTNLTVVFPSVEVGDTVVFSYKITDFEPIFPQQFSVFESLSKSIAYDDVRMTINWPSSLWAQYHVRGLTVKTDTAKDGRRIIEWTYDNKQPLKEKRLNWTVYNAESDPGFAFSTFRSYAEISNAYGLRARPKAAVTERIQKLADEIVKERTAPLDVAKALYEWVATNISYAGNCIGVGVVVPHDLTFVLENKMGDCKDHATLLQALLAAKGITSTQALINSGSVYTLHRTPVVSMVNHVINYIPSLDLYADSTSNETPFGMLPFSDAGKPVLLVDGHKDGTRTPVPPVGSNQQHMKSVLKISSDGAVSGDIEISMAGMFGARSRATFRHMSKDAEEDLVKNLFKKSGYIGSGKFTEEDPTALVDTHHYNVKFDMQEYVRLPGPGAFSILPLFFSQAAISGFASEAISPNDDVDVVCASGKSVEEYTFKFPKNMKILSIPKNIDVSNAAVAYRATYRLKGDTLMVSRTFDDRTPGNICSPEFVRSYKIIAAKALQNLKEQVLYK